MAIKKKKKNYNEILYELQKEAVRNNTGASNDDLEKVATQQAGSQLRTAYQRPYTSDTTKTINRTKYSRTSEVPISPTKSTTTKKKVGLFDAFDDGYDIGDVTKTILTGGKMIWDSATVTGKGFVEDPKQTIKTIGVGIGEGFNKADKMVNNALDDIFEFISPWRDKKEEDELSVSILELEKFAKTATDEQKEAILKQYEEKYGTDDPMYKSVFAILNDTDKKDKNILTSKYYDTDTYKELEAGELSDTQKEIYEQSQSLGGMGYDLAVGWVSGGILKGLGATSKIAKKGVEIAGKASLFTRTQQSSYEQAVTEGYTEKEARLLGVTVGGIEVGLESIGFDELKGLDSIAKGSLVKKAFGEATEELLAPYGEAFAKKLYFGEEIEWEETTEEALKGAGAGAVLGVVMGSGGKSYNKVDNVINKINNGETVTDAEMAEAIKELEANEPGVIKSAIEKATAVMKEELQVEKTTEEDIAPTQDSAETLQTNVENTAEVDETQAKRRYYQYTPVETDSEITKILKESASKTMNDSKRSHEFVDMVAKFAEKTGTKYRFTNDGELKQLGHLVERTDLKESEQKQLLELKQQLNEAKTQQEYDEIQSKIDNITHYKTNGLVTDDGEVLINIDSQKALNRVVGHETFHLVENEAEAVKLREFAKKYAETKGDYQARLDRANRLYKNTKANIENEVTADIIGDYLFTDQQFINGLSTEQPNLFQKIYNEIKHWIKMATAGSKEARQLEQLQHSFEKALNSKQNASNTNKITGEYTVSEEFKAEINRKTAKNMSQIENNEFIRMASIEELDSINKNGGGYRTTQEIDDLRNGIKNNGITEPLEITEDKDGNRTLENGNHRLERAKELGLSEVPIIVYKDGNLIKTSAVKTDNTKYSLTDNQGRELSKEQQEYFKDSKVRDGDGNLVTVYHGTTEEINVFDKNKLGSNTGASSAKEGFFFTSSKQVAEAYSMYARPQYIRDLEKKYQDLEKIAQRTGSKEDWRARDEAYLEYEEAELEYGYGGRTDYENQKEVYLNITNPLVHDFAGLEYRDESYYDLIKQAKENGNDGVILKNTYDGYGDHDSWNNPRTDIYVAFESNQIKNVDNTNPTESDDTRYSLSEAPTQDSEGRALTKGQRNYFKNEDANLLDKNGNLKVLYHGTPFGKFTTFKGKVFFFSEDYRFAEDYADSKSFEQGLDGDREVIEAYIKAENVFDATDPTDIQKLREALPDKVRYWSNTWDKETLLERLQRRTTLEPKWKPEQIVGKKFGDYIGDDRSGYNTDMFVGVNENNEIVYISQEYGLQQLTDSEKAELEKKLMNGEEATYTTYKTMFGELTETQIREKIEQLKQQNADKYYIKSLSKTLEEVGTWYVDSTNHKLKPKTTTQENTMLDDIDNWTYFETAFDPETGKDIVDIIQDLGYDAINIYENGISNYIAFNPNQIKSVTNENPTDNPDINMSLSEADEDIVPTRDYDVFGKDIKADVVTEDVAPASQNIVENAGSDSLLNMSEEDIAPTEGTFTFDDGTIPEVKGKKNIINEIRSNFNIKATEARELYNKIADMEEPTIDDVYSELEQYREIKFKEQNEYFKEIQSDIRGTKLDISSIKSQLSDYDRSYRASLMGKGLYLGKTGQSIDTFYQELSNAYPNVFPSDITSEADQLEAITDFMYKDTVYEITEYIEDNALMDLARGIHEDIGNNERLNHSKRHKHFLTQAIKDGELAPPEETYAEFLKGLPDKLPDDYAPFLEMAREIHDSKTNKTYEDAPVEDELDRLSIKNPTLNTAPKNVQEQAETKVTKKKSSTLNTLQYLVSNRNVEIDKFSKETGNKNIKFYADHVNNIFGEVSTNINNAQTDNNGKAIGKSLVDIFNQARKAELSEAFDDYLFHLSNIERYKNNKGSQVPLAESDFLVKEYEKAYPEMKAWAKEVNQYNRNNLMKQAQAGLVSRETASKIVQMYDFYVPFYENIEKIYVPHDTREIISRGTVKRAKGGADRNLLSFEEAMMRQTQSTIKAIRRNQLNQEIVKSSDVKVKLGAEKTPELYADDKGYYVTAYINGETLSAKVSEELYKGLQNNLEQQIKDLEQKMSGLTKPLQKLSNIRRNLLTTWSPTFVITNPVKDFQDALLNSKYTKDWFKNYKKAFKEIATGKGEHVQEFLNMYGSASLMGDYATDSGVYDVTQGAKIKNKLSRVAKANEVLELAPRYAEYLASLENGTSQMEALYNAREVTTNFGRGGVITKALNRNGFTFLNASVQGFDKLIRNFSGENGAKGVVNASLKAVMMGVVPALFNALMYDDDEEYQALPDYIKDNYYLIRTGEGKFVRIPKGRMLSIFGSAGRRTLELMQGEEDAFEGFIKNAYSQVGIQNPLESNILAPLIQAYGSENGTTWYGTDIVPSRLQDVPQAEQYDETTDKFSIWLGDKLENSPFGEMINASPYKINYVLDQYTGGIGDLILPIATEEGTSDAETLPEMMLAPIKDKFTANSTTDNKYVSDVYTLSDELYKKSNSAYASEEDMLKSQYIYSITSEMGELYAERRAVQNDDSLTKAEKFEKSQAIKEEINRLAKEGLDGYENINKTENYAIVGGREFNKYIANDGTEKWGSVFEDELEEMNSLGMELEEKSEYVTAKMDIEDIKKSYDDSNDYASRKRDIIGVIKGTNLTDDQKAFLYDRYYASTETLNAVTTLGIDFDSYLDYESQEFEADKDEDGKSISGSKKKKVFDYINSMDIDFEQKLVLAKLQYNSYDEYNHDLINYLNESDLTYEEEVELLKKMGFEVDSEGNITW